jgi:ribonucleoside-diphosphate reductase alpha chain
VSNDSNFSLAGTNPCAEEPLPANGSCLLGSINLAEFAKDGEFKYSIFKEVVRDAVVALNEVLMEGLPLHPLEAQRQCVNNWRQVGLGIMGLADCLIHLGIVYGSKEALDFSNELAFIMADNALMQSSIIAKEKGTYPKYNKQAVLSSEWLKANTTNETIKHIKKYGLANSQLLTIAPTGTLSSMLGVSGGIEPIYALSYTRKTESLHNKDVYYEVFTPIVEKYMEKHSITNKKDIPPYFVTSMELDYKSRIAMQSVWQQHIDASISSTVNVPENFTVEQTYDLYLHAWKSGLKGITIFRDNCARIGILTTKKEEVIEEVIEEQLIGKKRKIMTGCGKLHVNAFFDSKTGKLAEIFLSKGSEGGCQSYMIGLSRSVSLASRKGASIDEIVDQLNSVPVCPSYAIRRSVKKDVSDGTSCPSAIGRSLVDMQKEIWEMLGMVNKKIKKIDNSIKCPECGTPLSFEGGCNSCKNCGFSKCDL